MKAVWNGKIIAESTQTIVVEGNHYFPPESISMENLRPSSHQTTCYWKGRASYYDVVVADQVNQNAAWYYPNPSDAARQIKDYVAFWQGIKIEE
jgi:uncharacterized protein (DUF427 family)